MALLDDKHAVIFAASGAIASGVARRYALEGARLSLSARTGGSLDALADELRAGGATVDVAVVDATDPAAVAGWLDDVVATTGRIDTVFNGIGARPNELGYPADSLAQDVDAFLSPYRHVLASQFLTAREAIRRMLDGEGGSVVTLSATLSGMAAPFMTNISGVCGAIEATTRALAGEFGPHGVRVNCLRASAMPETRTIRETAAGQAALRGEPPEFGVPPLGRPVGVVDTASAAAFLASGHAGGMTAQTVTVCAGQFPG